MVARCCTGCLRPFCEMWGCLWEGSGQLLGEGRGGGALMCGVSWQGVVGLVVEPR